MKKDKCPVIPSFRFPSFRHYGGRRKRQEKEHPSRSPPSPVGAREARPDKTGSGEAAKEECGGRGGAFWSPPPEPARSPGLSAGGVIHQSSARRLLEVGRRHQENIPPQLSPEEASDDGAGEGGEEREDKAAGRRSEAKASTPSYSDLTPCHPPSPSLLAFSSPLLLPRSAKPQSDASSGETASSWSCRGA